MTQVTSYSLLIASHLKFIHFCLHSDLEIKDNNNTDPGQKNAECQYSVGLPRQYTHAVYNLLFLVLVIPGVHKISCQHN